MLFKLSTFMSYGYNLLLFLFASLGSLTVLNILLYITFLAIRRERPSVNSLCQHTTTFAR